MNDTLTGAAPTKRNPSLLLNVLGAVAVALLVSAPVFIFNWNGSQATPFSSPLLPPDWVIGAAWAVWFAGFGFSRYRMSLAANEASDGIQRERATSARRWIDGYIVFCAIYPFYALLPASAIAGLLGNVATAAFALFVIWRVRPVDRVAVWPFIASIAWVAFASLTICQALGLVPGGIPR
jgi:tryptophan-rich sensory protein